MEPTDIDKLLKAKLQESSNIHRQEMDVAKPFVWSAIQKNISNGHSLRWYHLAAAFILLLISFVFVLQNVQKSHENEMVLLSQKIDQLQQHYVAQETALQSKDQELGTLMDELKNVELKLNDIQHQQPEISRETIVYRTDTVVVKQIEYITRNPNPVIAMETSSDNQKTRAENIEPNNKRNTSVNYAIYPSMASQNRNQKSETIKVKFLKASRN